MKSRNNWYDTYISYSVWNCTLGSTRFNEITVLNGTSNNIIAGNGRVKFTFELILILFCFQNLHDHSPLLFYFLKKGMARCVEKLNRLTSTIKTQKYTV